MRELAKLGILTVELRYNQWKCACLVMLPAGIQKGYVKAYDEQLYPCLKKLLDLAKEENVRLWKIQRQPKQEELGFDTKPFTYGTSNPDWEEIC